MIILIVAAPFFSLLLYLEVLSLIKFSNGSGIGLKSKPLYNPSVFSLIIYTSKLLLFINETIGRTLANNCSFCRNCITGDT